MFKIYNDNGEFEYLAHSDAERAARIAQYPGSVPVPVGSTLAEVLATRSEAVKTATAHLGTKREPTPVRVSGAADTRTQQAIDFIRAEMSATGKMPTIKEIMERTGLHSNSTVCEARRIVRNSPDIA